MRSRPSPLGTVQGSQIVVSAIGVRSHATQMLTSSTTTATDSSNHVYTMQLATHSCIMQLPFEQLPPKRYSLGCARRPTRRTTQSLGKADPCGTATATNPRLLYTYVRKYSNSGHRFCDGIAVTTHDVSWFSYGSRVCLL